METTADKKIAEAKQKLQEARVLLHEATHPDTDGFEDYKEEYQEKILDVLRQLPSLYKKLY